jgi:hypothetical protein
MYGGKSGFEKGPRRKSIHAKNGNFFSLGENMFLLMEKRKNKYRT